MGKFVVKHYEPDDRPIIKGFGFDGLEIGGNRKEAEEFIDFINSIIEKCEKLGIEIRRTKCLKSK